MPDADVEPEPCRDCMTPIPPGWGWCEPCDRKRRNEPEPTMCACDVGLPQYCTPEHPPYA